MIENVQSGERYIGSAITNRIYVRFRNHLIHRTGSRTTAAAVVKYGLENFKFYILEYYTGLALKENLNQSHLELLNLETKYIKEYYPEYNVSQIATSKPSKLQAAQKKLEQQEKYIKKIAELRQTIEELQAELYAFRAQTSKPVTLYNQDGSVHSNYASISEMAKAFNCCNKTITQVISQGKQFRSFGRVKWTTETPLEREKVG